MWVVFVIVCFFFFVFGFFFFFNDTATTEIYTLSLHDALPIFSWPPRSYAERVYNIARWTEMPRGGHFAALEQPTLLIDDIRTFARTLR